MAEWPSHRKAAAAPGQRGYAALASRDRDEAATGTVPLDVRVGERHVVPAGDGLNVRSSTAVPGGGLGTRGIEHLQRAVGALQNGHDLAVVGNRHEASIVGVPPKVTRLQIACRVQCWDCVLRPVVPRAVVVPRELETRLRIRRVVVLALELRAGDDRHGVARARIAILREIALLARHRRSALVVWRTLRPAQLCEPDVDARAVRADKASHAVVPGRYAKILLDQRPLGVTGKYLRTTRTEIEIYESVGDRDRASFAAVNVQREIHACRIDIGDPCAPFGLAPLCVDGLIVVAVVVDVDPLVEQDL